MGGKPSKATSADKRLKENKPKAAFERAAQFNPAVPNKTKRK